MKKSTIGVLGVGEVGTAVAQIFAKKFDVFKKDINYDQIGSQKLDVLHVCIPYSQNFIKFVTSQVKINKPDLVIVHSTVMPETTQKIFKKIKIPTVHSPIMGTHPNLTRDIQHFAKVIGPCDVKSAKLAKEHFSKVNIKTIILASSKESEIGKLLDSAYYAINILYSKFVGKLCRDLNLEFDNVYTQFNKVYNTGYKKRRPNVIRPVLKFQDGPIGGHCVVPNVLILESYKPNLLLNFIIKANKELSSKT